MAIELNISDWNEGLHYLRDILPVIFIVKWEYLHAEVFFLGTFCSG